MGDQQEHGWQLIETAPKDGTYVDLWIVNETGRCWREPDCMWYLFMGETRQDANYYGWGADRDPSSGSMSEMEEEYKDRYGDIHFRKATHWMPLPAAPVQP